MNNLFCVSLSSLSTVNFTFISFLRVNVNIRDEEERLWYNVQNVQTPGWNLNLDVSTKLKRR